MRKNNGITLMILVITVIVMIILAAVTLTYGMETYQNIKINRFVTQMQLIQKTVDNFYEDLKLLTPAKYAAKMDELDSQSQPLTPDRQDKLDLIFSNEKWKINGEEKNLIGNKGDFKFFNTNDMLLNFGLDNLSRDDEFAINFVTREVISMRGEKYKDSEDPKKDRIYYTQYNPFLPNSQSLIHYNLNAKELKFDSCKNNIKNYGLSASIVVTGISVSNTTLSYKETSASAWKTVENHTIKGEQYEIPITKTGKYDVRVKDVEGREYKEENIKVVLHNSPKLETGMDPKYFNNNVASDNGSWYNYRRY